MYLEYAMRPRGYMHFLGKKKKRSPTFDEMCSQMSSSESSDRIHKMIFIALTPHQLKSISFPNLAY